MVEIGSVKSDIHLGYRFGCKVIGILSRLARSRERWSFGVDDTEVLGSTSIAFSEALGVRDSGTERRVSGLEVRLILRPCEAAACGALSFGGAAVAASTWGAGGDTTASL